MIATGTWLKDRYRLERLLGRGGMASVWLASDDVLERPVAVKILADTISSDPEFLARFRREARIAAGVSHPNLIGVYDYAEGEERPYLVMEYVAGENLAERMSADGEIDSERMARELLGALAHIHAAGIVHRDVKPQNVVIGPDGSAKLIDFGIALPRDATALTRTGNLLGTARYIAPEVMHGNPATERSDLYSCGVMLRDCMGSDPPGQLPELVDRLCAAEPHRRPASATEALARLERRAAVADQPTQVFAPTEELAMAEESGTAEHVAGTEGARTADEAPATDSVKRAPPTGHTDSPPPRRAWGRAAAVLAACAALAGAFLLIGDGSQEKPGGRADSGAAASGSKDDEASGTASNEVADAQEPAPKPEPAGNDPDLGSALNQEGFELIQAGDHESAVPVLEEAIRAFPPETEDLDYAYALFNLGNALRLSGRPDEAVPILERRLAIPNQTGVVRRELTAARSEAGL